MPDDANLPPVPTGNPAFGEPPVGDPPPAASAPPGADAAGNVAGGAGGEVLGGPPAGGGERPPKPRRGPGKGNTWGWDVQAGEWRSVRKPAGELTPEAERTLKNVGWAAPKPSAPAGGGALPAQLAPVPPAFLFDLDGNRAFLAYALDALERADQTMLREVALEILAGTPHESRADELADRFFELSRCKPEEREALVSTFLDFLKESQVNVPPSARGVLAACLRVWRGRKVREEMRKELAALKGAAK